jgi:hypothetical protein
MPSKGKESTAPREGRNAIVHRFLGEAVNLLDREGNAVMSKAEIFDRIGIPLDHDTLSYLAKLDFIREESATSFSLTQRGETMGRKEDSPA